MQLEPVAVGTRVHYHAARSVWWEVDGEVADPVFEKEAWLTTALLRFGPCGFTCGDQATVYYCAPSLARGIGKLPTGPVAADAAVLTSLFVNPAREGRGLEAVLIDATLMDLTSRGISAVEAFGCRDGALVTELLGVDPARIGMPGVEHLESAGFRVVEDHPATPRLRVDLPPEEFLTANVQEELLSRALA